MSRKPGCTSAQMYHLKAKHCFCLSTLTAPACWEVWDWHKSRNVAILSQGETVCNHSQFLLMLHQLSSWGQYCGIENQCVLCFHLTLSMTMWQLTLLSIKEDIHIWCRGSIDENEIPIFADVFNFFCFVRIFWILMFQKDNSIQMNSNIFHIKICECRNCYCVISSCQESQPNWQSNNLLHIISEGWAVTFSRSAPFWKDVVYGIPRIEVSFQIQWTSGFV